MNLSLTFDAIFNSTATQQNNFSIPIFFSHPSIIIFTLQTGPDSHFLLPPPVDDDIPNVNEKDDDSCTPLHVAILNGKLEAARVLLEAGARVTSKCDGCPALHMAVCTATHPEHAAFAVPAIRLLVEYGGVVFDRDDFGRTPLHWAAASGLTDVAEVLLESATAYATAAQQQQQEQHEQDVVMMMAPPPPPPSSGGGRTTTIAEKQLPSAAAATPTATPFPTLYEFQDKQGNTALHLAARYCHPAMVHLLVSQNPSSSSSPTTTTTTTGTPLTTTTDIKQRNKAGMNSLHLAALSGNVDSVRTLLAACPAAANATTRQGHTPADLAARRGHTDVVTVLMQGTLPISPLPGSTPNRGHHKPQHTLILAPTECLSHHTAPWPIVRGDSPPPENVNRITVLTEPGVGVLRTCEFVDSLRWDERFHRAPMGDILRVHNWAYVRRIQAVCDALPDDPSEIGHLDGDTAVSRRTFAAALAAAGSVTHGVDEVVTGRARNAFCAVRPPGHHAGPSGVVTSAKDPNGSHGFCLFNNVAIGAAYAMTVHRHAGIKRVAILDFDVHHGNGTEACVANTAPSLAKYAFSTPYGEGVQQFPVYHPWHDSDDKDNIFFASVQGYGPKAPGYMDAFVYPGSGATCDTRGGGGGVSHDVEELAVVDGEGDEDMPMMAAIDDMERASAEGHDGGGGEEMQKRDAAAVVEEQIDEDPDDEFVYSGGEMPRTEGPRIIDVGIPGPGSKVALWRRSWRDKILPALVKFDPDLIFVSAGFDAHKKDDINFAYIGVQEKDYEWLTDQIVQVANRCCSGRVVSVLEGGYKIQGKVVSAFARSVAAHVRALAENNGQNWDPKDARWEREHEKQLRAEAEAKRAAAIAAAATARAAAIAAMEAEAAAASVGGGEGEREMSAGGGDGDFVGFGGGGDGDGGASPPPVTIASPDLGAAVTAAAAAVPVAAAAAPPPPLPPLTAPVEEETGDNGGRKKRRRSTVDYVALNKKLEEEAAGGGDVKPPPPPQ